VLEDGNVRLVEIEAGLERSRWRPKIMPLHAVLADLMWW
jgi:hypothetical protein